MFLAVLAAFAVVFMGIRVAEGRLSSLVLVGSVMAWLFINVVRDNMSMSFRIFLFYIVESILACCAGWLFLLVIIVLTTGMGVSRVSSAVGFVMLGVGLVFCAILTALFLGLPLIRFLQDREATLRQQGDVQ